MSDADIKKQILDISGDIAQEFLSYDCRPGVTLPIGTIKNHIKQGYVTIDDVVKAFHWALLENIRGHYERS